MLLRYSDIIGYIQGVLASIWTHSKTINRQAMLASVSNLVPKAEQYTFDRRRAEPRYSRGAKFDYCSSQRKTSGPTNRKAL
ncbi:hypothetical protein AYI69_g3516 [Smittium culicis]|uniref:Uncharacterized protein n=1 Tax=Smittium culicis TaxID=133412 RepID=A0A1R1YJG4_9FUNG|nr:hypothetical protein AYI69_g3516 [Smittium culicis]